MSLRPYRHRVYSDHCIFVLLKLNESRGSLGYRSQRGQSSIQTKASWAATGCRCVVRCHFQMGIIMLMNVSTISCVMIEFRNYDESLLDDLYELIEETSRDWEWVVWYPSKEQLKQIYSQEGFTPETRHFVYDGGQLVAFLSSAVEDIRDDVQYGSVHIPFIRKGHEGVREQLLQKTLETLRSRGVQVVYARIHEGWGDVSEILKQSGFKKQELLAYRTLISVEPAMKEDYKKPDSLHYFRPAEDFDAFSKIFPRIRQQVWARPDDQPVDLLERWKRNDTLIAGVFAKKDDEIVSGSMMFGYDDPKKAFLGRIFELEGGNDEMTKSVLDCMIHRAHTEGIQLLWHQLDTIDHANLYRGLGYKLDEFNHYTLDLELP